MTFQESHHNSSNQKVGLHLEDQKEKNFILDKSKLLEKLKASKKQHLI